MRYHAEHTGQIREADRSDERTGTADSLTGVAVCQLQRLAAGHPGLDRGGVMP